MALTTDATLGATTKPDVLINEAAFTLRACGGAR